MIGTCKLVRGSPVERPLLTLLCVSFLTVLKSTIWFQGLQGPRDNGLKLFLEKEDMERLYDFEEECMEGYFREQEVALHQSTEECIKTTTERVENMAQKIEDINQKENLQVSQLSGIYWKSATFIPFAESDPIPSIIQLVGHLHSDRSPAEEGGRVGGADPCDPGRDPPVHVDAHFEQ